MQYRYLETPIGRLLLAGEHNRLAIIGFSSGKGAISHEPGWILRERAFAAAARQLGEYFARKRQHFDLELAPAGSDFQRSVWQALTEIPYGETRSYGELACRLGRPGAARAVGAANARNPLPIVVPCHRVIGSSGSLTGFAGGVDIKRYLLELESPQLPM